MAKAPTKSAIALFIETQAESIAELIRGDSKVAQLFAAKGIVLSDAADSDEEEDEDEPAPKGKKAPAKSKGKKAPVEDEEDWDEEDEEPAPKGKKAPTKGKKAPVEDDEDEDEDEPAPKGKKAPTKGKKKSPEDIAAEILEQLEDDEEVELDDLDHEVLVAIVASLKLKGISAKKAAGMDDEDLIDAICEKFGLVDEDEEDEDDDEDDYEDYEDDEDEDDDEWDD